MRLLIGPSPVGRFLVFGFIFASCAASPAGALTVNDFPAPTPFPGPQGIAVGPDGNLWFTEYAANQIGRVTPAGVITEFPIPTARSGPWGIVAGPDGNLWFTERLGHNIGRITLQGVVTEFASPTGIYPLNNIAAGADGNLWFASNGWQSLVRGFRSGDRPNHPIRGHHVVPVFASNSGRDRKPWHHHWS
jgi:streptogramin lyase